MRAVLWKPLLRLPLMTMVELDDEEPRRRRCCCCGVRPHVVVVVAAKTPARDDDQVAAAALLAAVLGMHAAPAALLAVTVRNILAFPSALRSLRLAEFDTVWAICSRGPIGVLLSWERGAARAAAFLTCVIFFFSHTLPCDRLLNSRLNGNALGLRIAWGGADPVIFRVPLHRCLLPAMASESDGLSGVNSGFRNAEQFPVGHCHSTLASTNLSNHDAVLRCLVHVKPSILTEQLRIQPSPVGATSAGQVQAPPVQSSSKLTRRPTSTRKPYTTAPKHV